MPTEIGNLRPLPPMPQRNLPGTAELTVKLAQGLSDLLAIGDKAQANVLNVRDASTHFQLVLRLTLNNGQQKLVSAESPQPIPAGSTLQLSALSSNQLIAALISPGNGQASILESLDLELMPLGSLLQGKVESSQLLPTAKGTTAVYQVLLKLLNSPLAGQSLKLESPQTLAPGTLLTAQVQGEQSLQFLPLSNRLNQLELSTQLTAQLQRQASLEPLLKALLQSKTAQLPRDLRQAVERLLSSLPELRQLTETKGLAEAIRHSGAFFESQLLRSNDGLPQDLKANLLRLIALLLPQGKATEPEALPGTTLNLQSVVLPNLVRQALGLLNKGAAKEALANSFPLANRMLAMDDQGQLDLLKLATAALARLQSHQLSSLVQREVLPDGTLLNTWQTEIPLRQQQHFVPLQLRIQQEEQPASETARPRESLWRVELAFDLDPLGPLQAQATLSRGCISSQLWAERPETAQLIDAELGRLRQRLQDAGLSVGELSCTQGKPPQGSRTLVEQRWVDETA